MSFVFLSLNTCDLWHIYRKLQTVLSSPFLYMYPGETTKVRVIQKAFGQIRYGWDSADISTGLMARQLGFWSYAGLHPVSCTSSEHKRKRNIFSQLAQTNKWYVREVSQSSEDDSVEAWVKRVYSYLLNYALTVKGKKSLYYLNYIQRKYIKTTSKSQNRTHFAVFRPSRREAGTTKSLLRFLGVRRAVRDQNTAHFNTHSRPVAPSWSRWVCPRKATAPQAQQCTWTSRQLQAHFSSAFSLTETRQWPEPQPTLFPAQLMPQQHILCISEPGLHSSSTRNATGNDPSLPKFNTAQSA